MFVWTSSFLTIIYSPPAHGVDLCTEMYVIYKETHTSHRAITRCFGSGTFTNFGTLPVTLATCQYHPAKFGPNRSKNGVVSRQTDGRTNTNYSMISTGNLWESHFIKMSWSMKHLAWKYFRFLTKKYYFIFHRPWNRQIWNSRNQLHDQSWPMGHYWKMV